MPIDKEGALARVLSSLLRRGLLAEKSAARGDKEWRRSAEGKRLTLAITAAGLAAIGVDEANGDEPTPGENATTAKHSPKLRPGTKGATIAALLSEVHGATLAELMEVSGWQAHSMRGFLSGTLKKKLGIEIASVKDDDGERRYRIAA